MKAGLKKEMEVCENYLKTYGERETLEGIDRHVTDLGVALFELRKGRSIRFSSKFVNLMVKAQYAMWMLYATIEKRGQAKEFLDEINEVTNKYYEAHCVKDKSE